MCQTNGPCWFPMIKYVHSHMSDIVSTVHQYSHQVFCKVPRDAIVRHCTLHCFRRGLLFMMEEDCSC